MYLYARNMFLLAVEAKIGQIFPELVVIGSCAPPYGYWEINPGSFGEL